MGVRPESAIDALADVARLGPFFTLSTDPAEAADPTWEDFPGRLRPLMESAARRMIATEDRVAASTVHLGLAARLWSPVLGCALAHGLVPSLRGLRHRPGAAVPLWLPEVSALPAADPAVIYLTVVSAGLEPLNAAVRDEVKIAEGLLWGNAASALAGALRVLADARPALARPSRDLARELLAMGKLRGTGTFTGPLDLRRRSCCLYYRVPGGGLCGDCCLASAPVRPGARGG